MRIQKKVFIDAIFVIVFGLVLIFNIYNNKQFLFLNIGTAFIVMIAVYFAYYSNHRQIDKRKRKDQLESLLQRMQKMLLDDIVTIIKSEDDWKSNRMFQRTFKNKIDLLKQMPLIKSENLDYVIEQFNCYGELVDETWPDIDALGKKREKLLKYIKNIDDKLDALILSLYR